MKHRPVWEDAMRSRYASRISAEQRETLYDEIGEMFRCLAVQPSETLLNDIIDAVLRMCERCDIADAADDITEAGEA